MDSGYASLQRQTDNLDMEVHTHDHSSRLQMRVSKRVEALMVCVTTSAIICIVVFVAVTTAHTDNSSTDTPSTLKLRWAYSDNRTLNFPVESRVYSFVSQYLVWVTQRGGGVSVWRMPAHITKATDPSASGHLEFIGGWGLATTNGTSEGIPLEGQDRHPACPDILVLAGIARGGGIFTVNASDPTNIRFLGYAPVASPEFGSGVLHVKLYVPPVIPHQVQRIFALTSVGWSSTVYPSGKYLCAVDVTNATRPFQVGCIDSSPVGCIEGVTIVGDVAFVGGFCSKALVSIYIGNLSSHAVNYSTSEGGGFDASNSTAGMVVMHSKSDKLYVQMVSGDSSGNFQQQQKAASSSNSDSPQLMNVIGTSLGDVFLAALWANPGGIAVFRASGSDVRDGGTIHEVSRIASPDASFANRVHVHLPSRVALLPLEFNGTTKDRHGGVALVGLRDVERPQVLATARLTAASRVYCACFHPCGVVAYVFSADEDGYYICEIGDGN